MELDTSSFSNPLSNSSKKLNYNHNKEDHLTVPFNKGINHVMKTKDKCQEMFIASEEDDLDLDHLLLEIEVDKEKIIIDKMMIIKL